VLKRIDVALATVKMRKKNIFFVRCNFLRSRISAVGIVARLRTGWAGVRFLVGSVDFSLLQKIGTCSGAHTASYAMGTGALLWGKAAGV